MSNGTLELGEFHPAANSAMTYLKSQPLGKWVEPLASAAISGNRLGEICYETLTRLLASEPVSDRYLLGLAWTLKELEVGTDL